MLRLVRVFSDNSPLPMALKKKNVVVIGGSFAGRRVEQLLRGIADVTVVDSKSFLEFTPLLTR